MNVSTANIVAAVLVISAGVAGGSSAARGCEFSQDARVVGFSADGSQALLRIQYARLTIDIVDLGTGKIVETFEILSDEEYRNGGNAKLRSQRWKAVEAKLVKRAFKIVPDLAPLEGDIRPGIKLASIDVENDAEELSGWSGRSIVAKRGADEVVLVSGSLAPPSDAGGYGPVYVSPGGRYLITSDAGCSDTIFVVDIHDLEAQLPPPPAQLTPKPTPPSPATTTTAPMKAR